MSKGKIYINGLLLAVLLLLGYHFLVADRAVVKLDVKTDNRTIFKIYYKDRDSGWSEKRVSAILIKPGETEYSFRLTDISKVSELRIDTSEKPAKVTVRSLIIDQHGFVPLRIDSAEGFAKLQPGSGIAEFVVDGNGFTVIPASRDPQLVLTLDGLQKTDTKREDTVRGLLIVLLSLSLVFLLDHSLRRYRFVVAMALAVLVLIAVMAGISIFNVHPDEAVHVKAAEYYQYHNLPPRVGDTGILDTYSKYGVSRLHSGEIAYFIAGKFAWFLQPLQLPDYFPLRIFNVSLFAFLVLLAAKNANYRLLLIPLLLSPQIWYIFSYFNSDAFGLFIILIISYQMVVPRSAWNRLLAGRLSAGRAVLAIPSLGLLLAVLLLLKLNFYFYGFFLFFYFVWRLAFGKSQLSRPAIFTALAVILIGGTMFAAVRLVDSAVNGYAKSEKVLEARELYAEKMFKPSTPLEKKYAYLQMRERGVSLQKILQNHRWGEKMFRSSVGEYGYMTAAASFSYYDSMRYVGLALLFVASAVIIIQGGWQGRSLLGITLASGLLLLAMTLYQSWSVDFQAQGRYLLPFVGMLSVLVFHVRKALAKPPLLLVFCTLYTLSVYSFIFVALAGLGKITSALG